MGSMGYHQRSGRERTLGNIVSEGYKYVVALVGTTETGDEVKGGYQLFKELDEQEIKDYAAKCAKEAGRDGEIVRITVYSLEAKLYQEFKL
ncbi:MAG: hypothetical protein AABY26_00785 [Nanoarchaeota archaeon]